MTIRKSSVFRKALYLFLLLLAVIAIYMFFDMSHSKQMAADVCKRSVPGTMLEDLLATVSEKDFKIIRSSEYIILVPKKGMGRANCTVMHDGRIIKSSKQGFSD